MSAAEDRQQEIQPNEIDERLAVVEEMLADKKVKLPDDVFKRAEAGLKNINEKLEKKLPIYESDFDFIEELKDTIKIAQQYNEAMDSLKEYGLYNSEDANSKDKKPPTDEYVMQIIGSKLTKEQKEAINKMQKPVLQIVPNRTCEEYVSALNKNKPMVNEEGGAYVSDWTKGAFGRANTRDNAKNGRITGWKVVITEGADAPAILSGDDTGKTLEERFKWFKDNFESKSISGIDIKSYMLLQMAALAKTPPRPIDDYQGSDKTLTMLNNEEIFENTVSGVYWRDYRRQVRLFEGRAGDQDVRARFRLSVVVDVP